MENSNGVVKLVSAVFAVLAAGAGLLEKFGHLAFINPVNVHTLCCIALFMYIVFDVASWYYCQDAVWPGLAALAVTAYWCLAYRTVYGATTGAVIPRALAFPRVATGVAFVGLLAWIFYEVIDNTDNSRWNGNAYTDSGESKAAGP